jgi:hypothetical protein
MQFCDYPIPEEKEAEMLNAEIPSPSLCFECHCLSPFFYLLQRGFLLKVQVGMSVEATLTQEFGLDSHLLDKIQTVFLNGKAVDDLESSVVEEGSILALSAAMPGLVGATLRRGSYYAAMRSQITAAEIQAPAAPKEGMVTLKLFNLLIGELAPIFLGRGIWVEKGVLRDFLAAQSHSFWSDCKIARIAGNKVESDALLNWHWPDPVELICLKVKACGVVAANCHEYSAT